MDVTQCAPLREGNTNYVMQRTGCWLTLWRSSRCFGSTVPQSRTCLSRSERDCPSSKFLASVPICRPQSWQLRKPLPAWSWPSWRHFRRDFHLKRIHEQRLWHRWRSLHVSRYKLSFKNRPPAMSVLTFLILKPCFRQVVASEVDFLTLPSIGSGEVAEVGPTYNPITCDHQQMFLQCANGLIDIQSAVYGRTSNDVQCPG